MALFVIPLGLKIVGSALAVTGMFMAKSGYDKISGSKEKIAEAQNRHEKNVKKFNTDEANAIKTMDRLGELEIRIMASFHEYSDLMEKIYDRPIFEKGKSDKNEIPLFRKEGFKQASEGANTLLGGIGSAAAGAFASFAASGAITATTSALGIAGTGVAISGLSGAAAANAVFATLGGGTIATGGGGIALGTAVFSYATFGVGLLIGGFFFDSNADKSVRNADEAFDNMLKAEEKISKCCNYLNVLKEYSERYEKALQKLFKRYQAELEKVKIMVNEDNKINYLKLTKNERLMVENLILIVDVLYKMCNVQFVLKAKTDDEPNNVNTEEINKNLDQAKKEFPDILVDEKEMEISYLSESLYVICGEKKTYRNKIVKFDSTIECAGELTFENCEIYYHRYSNTDKGQIMLIDDAKLFFKNCVLHCEAYSDKPFICSVPNHGVPSVYVSNSKFYDCSEFIAAEFPAYRFKYITIENSKFFNCINMLSRVELERDHYCRIVNCKFEYTQIANFYIRHGRSQEKGIIKEFINVSSGDFYLDDSQVNASKEVGEMIKELRGVRGDQFFVGPWGDYEAKFRVKNCSFTGVRNWACLTHVDEVRDCTFKDCYEAVKFLDEVATNCKFINCNIAIYVTGPAHIKNCNFKNWNNSNSEPRNNSNLLTFSSSHGLQTMEECAFEDIIVKELCGLIQVTAELEVSDMLLIKNCTFNNVEVKPSTISYYEPGGIIEHIKFTDKVKDRNYIQFSGCKFLECKGDLMDCYASWFKLHEFNPFKDTERGKIRIIYFTNCEGIESNGRALSGNPVYPSWDDSYDADLWD